MSFASFNRKKLSFILSVCNQISPKRSDVDIFTFSKIEIKGYQTQVSALNSGAFYSASIKSENLDVAEDSLSFLVKTDILTNAVNLIQDEIIGFEVNLSKHTLIVQGSKSKHSLRIDTAKLEDFSQPVQAPENLQYTVNIKTQDFISALRAAFISVGQAKSVYEPKFLNVCFTLRNSAEEIFVVSTDRYRVIKNKVLAKVEASQNVSSQEVSNFLVLPKNLQYLISSIEDQAEISLNFNTDSLNVSFGDSSITLRYGEGVYPDYDKIIPQSFTCNFNVITKDLLDSLKQVYLFAKSNTVNKSVQIKVNPTEKNIILVSQAEDGYSSEAKIDLLDYQGVQEGWSQSFNADYLIDYISTLQTEKILWESNPGKPSLLSPEGERETQTYLVSGLK
jgi:DNA polymerase-3 subunit beta